MKKVLVILPYKVDAGAKVQQIDFLYQTYVKKLTERGVMPLLCSVLFSEEMVTRLYHQCDGVLLAGGSDINPKMYSQEAVPETKVTNPLRDLLETKIIKMVMTDKKPLLGICRGMQLVNVVLGGSLIQHVEGHMVPEGSSYDNVSTYHGNKMIVESGTRLADMTGEGEKPVNCAHHQSVDKIGNGLRMNAKSADGLIEGLEAVSLDHFALLLQNHIETQDDKFSTAIWESFADEL